MDFRNKKRLLLTYGGFFVLAIIIWALLKFFPITSTTIFLTFFGLLAIPGFSLARLFKFHDKDCYDQKLLWLFLGFSWALFLCLVAVLVQINLTVLLTGYLASIVLLFIVSLVIDLIRPVVANESIDWKGLFKLDNLVWLLATLPLILIILSINQQGSSFTGDPTYHLEIVEKAFSGHPLSVYAVAFIKNQPHPAYAFMIWPVFLAELAKITHLTTYNLWGEISAILTTLVFLTWFGFFRKIFPTKYLAALAIVIFAVFTFGADGYLLTALPVPDGLCKLIFLPAALWLAFKYIFEEKPNFKVLSLASVILVLTAGIHLTQFFYFYFIMIAFMIGYSVFRFKDPDYKIIIKRMLTITFANLILMIPLFGYLQLKTNIINNSFETLSDIKADLSKTMALSSIDIFSLYAYILLPSTLLFLRKNRNLIALLAVMLIVPVVYNIVFLRDFLNSVLSYVFMKRLFSNVTWSFAIWALIFGSIFVIIDQIISRFKLVTRYIFTFILIILSIIIWISRLNISRFIFSRQMDAWLATHFWLFVGPILIIAIIIFWLQLSKKIKQFPETSEPKNLLIVLFLSFALVGILLADGEKNLIKSAKNDSKNNYWFTQTRDYTKKVIKPQAFGGYDTLAYIQKNVPAGSVVESNTAYRNLEILADVYMAAWPERTQPERELSQIYESVADPMLKVRCLSVYKVDYLLVVSKKAGKNYINLDNLSEYLTRVYQNTAVDLYLVNKDKVNQATNDNKSLVPLNCRAPKWQ